jgi:hypothetical protein
LHLPLQVMLWKPLLNQILKPQSLPQLLWPLQIQLPLKKLLLQLLNLTLVLLQKLLLQWQKLHLKLQA